MTERCPMCGQALPRRKGPTRGPINEEIGRRIRLARFARGFTLAELGAMLDPAVSQAAVSQWESGVRALTVERAVEVATVLGLNPSSLVEGLFASPVSRPDEPAASWDKNPGVVIADVLDRF